MNSVKIKKLLKKVILSITYVLIIFLACTTNASAAGFKYSNFDFDSFSEQNIDYWTAKCVNAEDEEECRDEIIESQKKFYTKLYKLLAKKEKKGYMIDDAIIIATIFFEYDPNAFNDISNSYNIDDNNDDDEITESAAYFENETDTLKLLINAMIGYERICYGLSEPTKVISESEEETDEEETTSSDTSTVESYICKDGGILRNINGRDVCLNKFEGSVSSISFADKFADEVESFFGIRTNRENNCNNLASSNGYSESFQETSPSKKVVEDGYWQFLTDGDYFDNKDILQHYYAYILEKTEHNHMNELTTSEKEEYKEDIVNARKTIIKHIKSIIETYRLDNPNEFLNDASSDSFWWPIGSNETTTQNGITYASGEPASVTITSKFSPNRVNPVSGKIKAHTGVDLSGGTTEAGTANAIAAKAGIVTMVVTGCTSYGDTECGDGYGNYVMIQHSDGIYTLYAHLHQNTITVKVGDSVSQGQVIGKIGSSGNSTGTHLHFEIRTNATTPVDPLDYIDPDNPRPSSVGGALVDMLRAFEGGSSTLVNGNSYKVICNYNDIPTVGDGITLKYNANYFAAHGYPLSTSNDYYNYCGATFPKDTVDAVFADVLNGFRDSVKEILAKNSIVLKDYQIDALTILKYQAGNINGFASAYSSYGTSQALCNNWWIYKGMNSAYISALQNRRRKECSLFVNGSF